MHAKVWQTDVKNEMWVYFTYFPIIIICIYVRGLGRIFQPGQRRTHNGYILSTYIVDVDTASEKNSKSEKRVLGLLVGYHLVLRLGRSK